MTIGNGDGHRRVIYSGDGFGEKKGNIIEIE